MGCRIVNTQGSTEM